jgi:TrmH family RNA methyltransferase
LLVEGPHAVAEAVDFLEQVFLAHPATPRAQEVAQQCRQAGVPVVAVRPHVLAALTDAETPQGVVGVARRPPADLAGLVRSATLLVVLDGVADPGNLGAILRCADAAGADGVVLTAGSVDPTNGKAVRASAGSLFHLPVVDGVEARDLVSRCAARGVRLIVATADAAQQYDQVSYTSPTAIVFGSEAHGLSAAMAAAAELAVAVPIARPVRPGFSGHAESLNLAVSTGIVLFEVVRQGQHAGADGDP